MSYTPEWKGPIEGYVVNGLAKNLWRLKPTHTHEDALQDAYVMFLRCAARYPLMDTPQHFMALFKTAWTNEFNDLSVKASNARVAISMTDLCRVDENGDEIATADSIGERDNDGALAVMIKEAPHDVMLVLNLFLVAPQELLELAMATWRKSGRHSPAGERQVEKMLGLPAGTNPLEKTERYFRA